MRICIVSSTVFAVPPPGYSGLEQLAWQQAEGLAAKGHEVSIVCPEGSRCDKATVIPCGPPGGWDEKRAFQHYHGELAKFDVIIDHSWNKWTYIAKGQGQLKAPVLGVCHAPVNAMFQSLPPGVDKPCFVCISQDQANHFLALFSREAKVAYNGIDLDHYKPMGTPRSLRFLFLARFSTIKGPDLAIDACRRTGVGLDLVGDTSITNEPEFLEQCKKKCDGWPMNGQQGRLNFDQTNRIWMHGSATRGECVWWFSQAYCLLHPNQRFREPFGLAPIEAQACGCPVIAWDNGAMRETVEYGMRSSDGKTIDGGTGFLVRSMEELVSAIKFCSDIPDSARKRCREWASQFSVKRMIQRYHDLCVEAVEGGGW